ncbi:BrnA antitoxin family protein [uncultured Tateyamaria sp.]|uniref:BrnA antitoxin family protein n=1 Tax=uncultured Tateyamaria sp. TaxID=455651 RepID=UPI0026355A1E|nr:BrnA antitoxin family protein [uncultured Tateyamaria sp.]
MTPGFDAKKAKAGGYTKQDWDAVDSPEATDDMLAEPMSLQEVAPKLAEALNKGGRPKSENPKQSVTLRLDPEVIEAFKQDGRGWQTRMNKALRKAAGI